MLHRSAPRATETNVSRCHKAAPTADHTPAQRQAAFNERGRQLRRLVFAVLAYVHCNPLPRVGYVFEHGPMFRSLASDGYRPALMGFGATFFGGHTF
jgi:hypothetical protein